MREGMYLGVALVLVHLRLLVTLLGRHLAGGILVYQSRGIYTCPRSAL